MSTDAAQERLTDLHHRYAPALLGYLTGLSGGNRQSAEDLLQETMIRAWRHLDAVPAEPEQTRRWLFTVARNVAIDAARRRKVRPAEVDMQEPDPAGHAADSTPDTVLAAESLRLGLRSLSGSHLTILTELYLRGRTAGETAQQLGLPVGTVKSRAHYALRSLRRAMEAPALSAA